MNDFLEKVKIFHNTFNAPVLDKPQIPTKERCELRINLIQEELNELKQAIVDNDLIEITDAYCDIMFVLCGSILEFGLGDKFESLFNEVHRSNMSKSCSSIQEALETLSYYKKKDGTEGNYKEINGKWVVYRNSDNKVLKNVNYSCVNLKDLL